MKKNLSLLFLLLSSCLLFAQNDFITKDFSYVDAKGNKITARNVLFLTKPFNASFFVENISAKDFGIDDSVRVNIEIQKLVLVNVDEYDLIVDIRPQNPQTEIEKALAGLMNIVHSRYRLIFVANNMREKYKKGFYLKYIETTIEI